MTDPKPAIRHDRTRRGAPWAEFQRRLAAALARMPPETYLILEAPLPDGDIAAYVQFAHATSDFRAEAVSSRYLPSSRPLTAAQERQLAGLGWQRPAPDAEGQNYFREWPSPAPFAEVARLAVRTLREVYGIEEPSGLRSLHESFRRDAVPDLELGIEARTSRQAPGAPPPSAPSGDEIAQLLEAAMARWLGVEHPVRDGDGDYPIRVGSAMMFVRLLPGVPPAVAIFAPILRDVARTADLLQAINDINARIRFGRVFWSEGRVLVAMELTAADITADQVAFACVELGNLADYLDDVLHGRFGGKTMFDGRPALQN